jgi:hypothetical protein
VISCQMIHSNFLLTIAATITLPFSLTVAKHALTNPYNKSGSFEANDRSKKGRMTLDCKGHTHPLILHL